MKEKVYGEGGRLSWSTEEYITYLEGKGFSFGEDMIGFIYFGKQYTKASDSLVNIAIELTLKVQKKFDGSFYVSLLETLTKNHISTKREAEKFAREQGLFQ